VLFIYLFIEHVLVGNSVQPLLMMMPSINPLGAMLGMSTFWCMYALVLLLQYLSFCC